MNWTERLVTDIRSTYLSQDYTSVHTENWASVYCPCFVATRTIKILILERCSQCATLWLCSCFACKFESSEVFELFNGPSCFGLSTGAGPRWVRSCSRAVLFWLKAKWSLTPKMRKKYWVSWVFSVAQTILNIWCDYLRRELFKSVCVCFHDKNASLPPCVFVFWWRPVTPSDETPSCDFGFVCAWKCKTSPSVCFLKLLIYLHHGGVRLHPQSVQLSELSVITLFPDVHERLDSTCSFVAAGRKRCVNKWRQHPFQPARRADLWRRSWQETEGFDKQTSLLCDRNEAFSVTRSSNYGSVSFFFLITWPAANTALVCAPRVHRADQCSENKHRLTF